MLNVSPNSAERAPQALADTLAALAATIAHDAEIAAVLRQAREQLQAIGWNRYARRINHQGAIATRRRAMRRRHQRISATAVAVAPSSPEEVAITQAIKAEIVGDMIRGGHADA